MFKTAYYRWLNGRKALYIRWRPCLLLVDLFETFVFGFPGAATEAAVVADKHAFT